MKNIKNIIFFITLLFLTSLTVHSGTDSLICGKEYKLRATSGWEGKGVLIALDSLTITFRIDHRILKIQKDQINEIVLSNKNFKRLNSNDEGIQEICYIILTGGRKINEVRIKELHNDTLIVKLKKENIRIPVDSIKSIVFPKESKSKSLFPDILYGISCGAVAGVVVGILTAPDKSGFIDAKSVDASIGLVVGGLTGGIIWAIVEANSDSDDEYDFTTMNKETKIKEIKNIIEDLK